MTISQEDRLAALQDISRTWLELLKATRKLSDEQLLKPGTVGDWSVKDVLGHVSFWEQDLIDTIAALDSGNEPLEIEDIEAANLEAAAEMAELSLDEIREQFTSTHEELMQLLETSASLTRELVEGATYGHYPEHAADVLGVLKS